MMYRYVTTTPPQDFYPTLPYINKSSVLSNTSLSHSHSIEEEEEESDEEEEEEVKNEKKSSSESSSTSSLIEQDDQDVIIPTISNQKPNPEMNDQNI